ncbi:MAG: pyridoxamine 5'-phosphate oxidase family protein [bacterium]|nr:pyridoxamine 5'-phosphate oxidase family protein [bacterium]MCP5068982.1 pyridoxamine 5'-phosphate oxidase family protein [bacterium]
MTESNYPPGPRSTLKRAPERGCYDRPTVHAILDEGLVGHVGFVVKGQPFVIPTSYVRIDDVLYLHGSPASRMMRELRKGVPVCVTVTHLDGVVLARSALHHSMNYRSVVVFGTARRVDDRAEKARILEALVEQVAPGRSADVRPGSPDEVAFTRVLAVPIEEASAKMRTGPPSDEEADLALPVWAGVIPLQLQAGKPIPDERNPPTQQAPSYVTGYRRGAIPPPE